VRIPRQTRILLIPDDNSPHREFSITSRMVVLLGVLGSLLTITVVVVLASFGDVALQARRSAELTRRVLKAEADLRSAGELAVELERMRELQARLLTMLGVVPQDAAADSLAPGLWRDGQAGDLAATAGAVLVPPPDRWPAAGFVTQEFEPGAVNRGIRPHLGIDIAGPEGTPIVAAGEGRVVRVGTDPYLGNFLEIQHGLDHLTVYGHCREVVVRPGDGVRSGQIVAYMGDTGETSACHLHFEVWQDGEAIDPRRLLRGDPPQT